jgi:hypothetical protein
MLYCTLQRSGSADLPYIAEFEAKNADFALLDVQRSVLVACTHVDCPTMYLQVDRSRNGGVTYDLIDAAAACSGDAELVAEDGSATIEHDYTPRHDPGMSFSKQAWQAQSVLGSEECP